LTLDLVAGQRAWRKVAQRPSRHRSPGPSQLHEPRERSGVSGLRQIYEHLLAPLLAGLLPERRTVGLIDATDLPAATRAYKKSQRIVFRSSGCVRWANDQDRPEPLVRRLQEAHVAFVAEPVRSAGTADSNYFLGRACQSRRSAVPVAQHALLFAATELASGHRHRRHGLYRYGVSVKNLRALA